MKKILAVIALLGAFQGTAYGGFDEGIAAAQAGNFEQAMKEWMPLAEQGSKSAQTNVARLYEKGAGVAQDYIQAVFWYRKAAAQGQANAQSSLGALYATGQGAPRNFVLAYFFYSLAEAGGDTSVQGNLEELAANMTPKQLEEARSMASGWKMGTPLPTTSNTDPAAAEPKAASKRPAP